MVIFAHVQVCKLDNADGAVIEIQSHYLKYPREPFVLTITPDTNTTLVLIHLEFFYDSDEGAMPIDSPTYVIPDEQDLLLTDVTDAELFGNVGELLGIQYLSEEPCLNTDMNLRGIIFGQNKRLMISLLCKRKSSTTWANIFFLVDTGSPHTYLAPSAINKLAGAGNNICKTLNTLIHSETVCIECYLSPQDKHFKDVNVLGMEAMSKLGFSTFHIDFSANEFSISSRCGNSGFAASKSHKFIGTVLL